MTDPDTADLGIAQEGIHFFGILPGSGSRPSSGSEAVSRQEVGSKAFNLMRMSDIGIPVPPGFVVGAQFCRKYLEERATKLPSSLVATIEKGLRVIEKSTGLTFGGFRRPLLVSVRSGAAISMPGMMDTLLNIGLSDATVSSLVRMTGNPHFARDSYRRLIQSYAEVVYGAPARPFDEALAELLRTDKLLRGVADLDSQELLQLCRTYLEIFEESTGRAFPQDCVDQLNGAVEAVFRSWESPRAREYRRIHNITGVSGTAVTVQSMVFGNIGSSSGSGVGFTRNPVTGENSGIYLDFAFNAQGEDVVSGRNLMQDKDDSRRRTKLEWVLPAVFEQVQNLGKQLELAFKDMQDFEFTVQEGKLYVLQCRTGKRTPWAALRIAVDMVKEGVIDRSVALQRLEGYDLASISHARLAAPNSKPLAAGISANRGVATGEIALDSDRAVERSRLGHPVILVRDDTVTADIAGMVSAAGILTKAGGKTSHAAVVARQMDKVCIVGCNSLSIRPSERVCSFSDRSLREGEIISLDGDSGNVYERRLDIVMERPAALVSEVRSWKSGLA